MLWSRQDLIACFYVVMPEEIKEVSLIDRLAPLLSFASLEQKKCFASQYGKCGDVNDQHERLTGQGWNRIVQVGGWEESTMSTS